MKFMKFETLLRCCSVVHARAPYCLSPPNEILKPSLLCTCAFLIVFAFLFVCVFECAHALHGLRACTGNEGIIDRLVEGD